MRIDSHLVCTLHSLDLIYGVRVKPLCLPQEKNKAGDVKTDSEKTSTDKKRERRKKKLRKRMKLKEKEKQQKILETTKPEQGKLNKKAVATKLKKLTKEGKASLLKVRPF